MSRYASGGVVPPRPNSDVIPVMLNRGCAVLPAAAVHRMSSNALERLLADSDLVVLEEEGDAE